MYNLENRTFAELKTIADKLGLQHRRSKEAMIEEISSRFQEYEEYKKEKVDKYTRKNQLGDGKEGTTYAVIDHKGRELAMKTFRKTKATTTLKREYKLQKKAAKSGIAPKIYDINTIDKWLVMEKMDGHFFVPGKDTLTKKEQKRIIEIYKILDDTKIFHRDCNLMNYMVKKGQIYLIDYGMAREITPKMIKSIGTSHPNYRLMTIGLVLKLKEKNFKSESYKYLLKHISKDDRKKYGLE